MEIGIGLDGTLGLDYDEQGAFAAEAARLGYTSLWTPETGGEDSFLICAMRWAASRKAVAGGITTGIGVSPVALRSPMGFAMSAGTMSKLTGGRFILGIGTGGAYTPAYRRTWDVRGSSTLGLMRDYLTTIHGLVAGETVTHDGPSIRLNGARLNIRPAPRTPVYLAALGPEMNRLAGELAEGVSLNWCTAEQVAWSRERVAEGAARAGRDPAACTIAEYIRVCVDDDVEAARRAMTRMVMQYSGIGAGTGPAQGYRAHFERMGFKEQLARVDEARAKGASPDELVDVFPNDLVHKVSYYGRADGAAAAFRRLAEGLDTAIVRVVGARPGLEAARNTLLACQPSAVASVK